MFTLIAKHRLQNVFPKHLGHKNELLEAFSTFLTNFLLEMLFLMSYQCWTKVHMSRFKAFANQDTISHFFSCLIKPLLLLALWKPCKFVFGTGSTLKSKVSEFVITVRYILQYIGRFWCVAVMLCLHICAWSILKAPTRSVYRILSRIADTLIVWTPQ